MSLVTPQDPSKRASRKPKSPAPKPPDTNQLPSHEVLMQGVSDSVTIPARFKAQLIRAIELFDHPLTRVALVELCHSLEADALDFATAYAAFIKACPPKILRERYHARLNVIASTHPDQAAAIQIMRDLDGQLPGMPVALEFLAVGQERELTVERLARRFKASHLSMVSQTLAGAIIGLDRLPEPTATARPWPRQAPSTHGRLSHGL